MKRCETCKKKLHGCDSKKIPNLSCYETIAGNFLIDYAGMTEKALCCPFCGYKPEEKE